MAARKKPTSTKKIPQLHRSLRSTFGFEELRPGQAEVIRSVLAGYDTLAVMPTGAGKSLCYQLPALHLEGTTIVVSPLISLMKDQVDKLQGHGVEALQVNSTLTSRSEEAALERIEQETSEFVFTTPERLTDPDFLQTLCGTTIDFVVIDEAHCISQWGHDFRPSYLALRTALEALGDPPILALTEARIRNRTQPEQDFTPGDQVSLPKFGAGKVEAIDGDSIVVRFPGGRSRKFKREFARVVRR